MKETERQAKAKNTEPKDGWENLREERKRNRKRGIIELIVSMVVLVAFGITFLVVDIEPKETGIRWGITFFIAALICPIGYYFWRKNGGTGE